MQGWRVGRVQSQGNAKRDGGEEVDGKQEVERKNREAENYCRNRRRYSKYFRYGLLSVQHSHIEA